MHCAVFNQRWLCQEHLHAIPQHLSLAQDSVICSSRVYGRSGLLFTYPEKRYSEYNKGLCELSKFLRWRWWGSLRHPWLEEWKAKSLWFISLENAFHVSVPVTWYEDCAAHCVLLLENMNGRSFWNHFLNNILLAVCRSCLPHPLRESWPVWDLLAPAAGPGIDSSIQQQATFLWAWFIKS